MSNNAAIKKYAQMLSEKYLAIDDIKIEIKAIVEKASGEQIDAKALQKVAKELIEDQEKLAKKLEANVQLDLFRAAVGLLARKGLETVE